MQIKHFLTKRENAYLWKKPITALETLCIKKHLKDTSSQIFTPVFFGESSALTNTSYKAWEQVFDITLSDPI